MVPEDMKSIVFLDIDGVLNTLTEENRKKVIQIDAEKFGLLFSLLKENNGYIVFTSDIARSPREKINNTVDKEFYWKWLQEVFSPRVLGRIAPPGATTNRNKTVERFQKDNHLSKYPYVIFDDNFIFSHKEDSKEIPFIKIDPLQGLLKSDIEKAQEFLSREQI